MNDRQLSTVAISGCTISLVGDKIVKASNPGTYGERLKQQAIKQDYFLKNFHLPNIRAPYIHSIERNRIVMKFINGEDYFQFFSTAGRRDVENFMASILAFLSAIEEESRATDETQVVKDKCASFRSGYQEFVDYIQELLSRHEMVLPTGFCHGDLTLSNIICADGTLYLIDFLDSFVSSFWVDIIKLRQDFHYKWVLRYRRTSNARLESILEYLDRQLSERYASVVARREFKILEAINFLRIEPYIDPANRDILTNLLTTSPLYEEFDSAYRR